MRSCVEEFADYTPEDIVGCIEGEPQVSAIGVIPNTTNIEKITGNTNEDSSINEGRITYDVIFTVMLPNKDRIQLIINIEAQNRTNPGYPLKMRMVYYGCRMVSSQYGRIFENAEYGKLKKVYTIWICTEPPKDLRNRIIGYSIQPYNIVGEIPNNDNSHDLMRCVVVYLGKDDNGEKNELLRLLEVLFTSEKDHEEKKQILHDEYNISMTAKMNEEVQAMCDLSYGIWEKGLTEGRAEGRTEGILETIKSLMANMGTSAEKALSMIGIPKSEWDNYLPRLV